MGLKHPAVGYGVFFAVKLVGYTAAAYVISEVYKRADRNPLIVGGVRTLLGVATGAAFFGACKLFDTDGGIAFILGLLPLRILEWGLLVWWFYDPGFQQQSKSAKTIGLGTLWSFVLDIPALCGFIMTAGWWIC
jgi:hypothetical protein